MGKEDYKMAMRHWKSEKLISLIPDRKDGNLLLNLGCGAGGDKRFLSSQGFQVIGIDTFSSPNTDIISDGHCLPFPDSVFDVVTSIKVFEHLHTPAQAVSEVARVLRPEGYFIGSVAFLEPFHADSYFNMSHLGITYLLKNHGFQVEELSAGWDFMQALFRNLIPHSYRLRPVFKLIAGGLLGIRGVGLRLSGRKEAVKIPGVKKSFSPIQLDQLKFAGSIAFKARKL